MAKATLTTRVQVRRLTPEAYGPLIRVPL